MKIALSVVLLAACTSAPPPAKITPPDTAELTTLYPTAQRVQEAPPFTLDLGTCAFENHAVPVGDVEGGDQFALTHVNDAGQCEVWIGYNGNTGLHGDIYCAFDAYGTVNVTTGSSGMGGCGGPPGTLPLAIDSPQCVALY